MNRSEVIKMTENIADASKKNVSSQEVADEKETNISRYFNNAPHTIFDEIVAPNQENYFRMESSAENSTSEFDSLPSCAPHDFFSTDNLIDTCQNADHGVSNDSYRYMWIPSEHTRKVLSSIATSTAGTNFLDRNNLTMPGLGIQGDMPDLIKNAATHLLGEDKSMQRNILTASDVTQDERGLRKLIQTGCYRAAINLSGRLLAVYAQGYGKINQPSKHTPHSLQLWFTRLALLTKLKQIEILEKESVPFGNLDKPDMYFTFYPELYGTRPGSMASFAFRLLIAEIPCYCGKAKQALDNLYKILATVNQIISNIQSGITSEGTDTKISKVEHQDAVKLWIGRKSRVLISIVNCAVGTKNYILAIDILQKLHDSFDWTKEQSDMLKSVIGRVHLFLGDISTAQKLLINTNTQESTLTVRELMDRGLLAVAQNFFQEAYNCFQTASNMDSSNVMLINNMAVCLLYTGQLKAAVHLYESMITRNPSKSLQEPILLNMCTSYELHTNHCKETKLHLLQQLNRYKGDSFDVQCLKLSI